MDNGTSPILRECTVRESARAAIQARKLPHRKPDRMWGGRGADAGCAVCNIPVTRDEMEFEIEFSAAGDTLGPVTHHVHIRCFVAWEFERDNHDLVRGGPPHLDGKGQ